MNKFIFITSFLILGAVVAILGRVGRPAREARSAAAPAELPSKLQFSDPASLTKNPKAFLTAEERVAQHGWLSDPASLQAAVDRLKETEKEYDDKREDRRIEAVAYLSAAASWPANPKRAEVMDAIHISIEQENLSGSSDQHARNSMSMDKVELFQVLLREDPPAADALQAKAEGTWLAPILHYARNQFEFLNGQQQSGQLSRSSL